MFIFVNGKTIKSVRFIFVFSVSIMNILSKYIKKSKLKTFYHDKAQIFIILTFTL